MTLALRGGIRIDDPFDVALGFLEAYWSREAAESTSASSFDESDLRRANRGGARISAAQIDAILERRHQVERVLRSIPPDASLARSSNRVPWPELARLFDAFAGLRGVGYSKVTKALYSKRPGLIPILDSVVQNYLTRDDRPASSSFAEGATILVQRYKRDLDDNLSALRRLQRRLAKRGYDLTEVRLLDVLIWSVLAGSSPAVTAFRRSRAGSGAPAAGASATPRASRSTPPRSR